MQQQGAGGASIGSPAGAHAASNTEVRALPANVLGFNAALFQAIGHIGPAIGLITSAPFIALYAGASIPLSFLLATAVALLVGNSVAQLSKHLPSAGGFYTFVGRGLGPSYGYMTAWIYFLFDPFIVSVGTPITMYYLQTAIQSAWGINIPWQLTSVIAIVGLGALNLIGVRRSLRVTMILGLSEIAIMVILGLGLVVKNAHGQHLDAFTPSLSPTGLHGVAFGLIYSILSFAGFESVAPLAEETRNPRRNLPIAIIVSILVGGFVFVLAGYGTVVGWGVGETAKTFPNATNPYYTLANSLFGGAAAFVVLAMLNSTLAVNLASQNAATRVWYAMGRTGTLPQPLGWVHHRYRTPWVAISAQTALSLVVSLGLGQWLGPVNEFGFLGLTVTLALICTYIMGNVAVMVYYRRERRDEINPLLHFVLPGLATLLLLAPLWASVWPFPAYPFNIAVYLVPIWLVLGFIVTRWLQASKPGALAQAGKMIFEEAGDGHA